MSKFTKLYFTLFITSVLVFSGCGKISNLDDSVQNVSLSTDDPNERMCNYLADNSITSHKPNGWLLFLHAQSNRYLFFVNYDPVL